MHYPCGHEQTVARPERMPHGAVLENPVPADNDVNLVLRVRLLRVVAPRHVDFDGHGAVPEEFEEGFTFVGLQALQGFLRTDFHG